MNGGIKATPINEDGTGNGFTLTNGIKGGQKVTLVDDNGTPINLVVGAGDTITGITSLVQGNDIILNVVTDKNPTGFQTTLTDVLKDIVGDLSSVTLTGDTLTLTMSTGTVKAVSFSDYVSSTELTTSLTNYYTKQEIETNYQGTKISIRRSERTDISQTINSNQAFNLLNLIRPQDLVFNDDNLVYTFVGTGINQVVKFPYVSDRVSVLFKVRLTGEVGGSSGTLRSWVIEVRRPDDVVTDSRVSHKISTSNMNRESTDISSYMRGANDLFITDGVKLMFNNTTGQEVQINTIQFTTELIY